MTQCVPAQAAGEDVSCDGSGTVTMDTAQGSELAQFINFVACTGQVKMAALGYAPLPPNVVEDDFQAEGRLPGGTTPPPPNPDNCANPTLTWGTPSYVSAVGPLLSQVSVGSSTLSVPSPSVGDAWVLAIRTSNASVDVDSISGGGVGRNWTKLVRVSDPFQQRDVEEWLGPISKTGPTPSVLSVQFSGPLAGTKVELVAQEFGSAAGASTIWTDDIGTGAKYNTESSTLGYPALTPAVSDELYVGFSQSSSDSSAGTTPGFTYESPTANTLFIYNPSVSSSVSPAGSQQGGLSVTTGALISAS